jgi:electron transfer flavoprotein alpha subunit
MENLLVLTSVEMDGSLAKSALEAIHTAQSLAQALNLAGFTVGLVGETVQRATDSVAACGANRFLGVAGAEFKFAHYASDAAAAEAIARAAQATVILAPAISRWSRVLAGVAFRLGGRIDAHATAVNSADGVITINRWYYRQRMEAVLRRNHRPWIITLEPGSQTTGTNVAGHATVEPVSVTLSDACRRTTVTGMQSPAADAQTIRPEARLLLVAGAGWTKKQADGQQHIAEAQESILGFLKAAKASLGGTKSLVDLSGEGQAVLPFMTHLNQVGQTGSTPRHPKGLATCCHGEEPHVVGWRFINERRVINLDPNCSWTRGKADVVYVADAFQVMAKVNELLTQG